MDPAVDNRDHYAIALCDLLSLGDVEKFKVPLRISGAIGKGSISGRQCREDCKNGGCRMPKLANLHLAKSDRWTRVDAPLLGGNNYWRNAFGRRPWVIWIPTLSVVAIIVLG
jgi:hypothetical protein